MESAIRRVFPSDHLKVTDNEWLISAIGTSKDISDKLGVTPGNETGPAIVFSMANYYGRAMMEVWDWIKAKAEKPSA